MTHKTSQINVHVSLTSQSLNLKNSLKKRKGQRAKLSYQDYKNL